MADSIPVGVPVAAIGTPPAPVGKPEPGSSLGKAAPVVKPAPVATTVVASDAAKTVETPEQKEAALKTAQENFERQKRVEEIKLKRLADKNKSDREAERKTWGEKLSAAEKFEKLKERAKLNPDAVARELWGDKYYDMMSEQKLNGNAPTAATIAETIDGLEEKLEKKYIAREEERKQKEQAERKEAAEREIKQAEQSAFHIAAAFWKDNGKEYPALQGTPEYIAANIAQAIRVHYEDTIQWNENKTAILRDGELWDPKEVAERWEASVLSHHAEIAKTAKYAEKLKSPVSVPGSQDVAQKVSRTLTNDLTGTTPGPKTKAASDEERRERANAAFLSVMSRKKV